MPDTKKPTVIESTSKVLVNRARNLSNKLVNLSKDDLQLLRRLWETPDDEQAKEVISKAVLGEYSIQELHVALAMLDGVNALPLGDKPLGFDSTQTWQPNEKKLILPPAKISTPTDESPPTPSVKATQEIAKILIAMPLQDFNWLSEHMGNPDDLRSRLIIIRNRLYRYHWEDVTATLAALQRTLPPK